ncbi:MAG: inosine/xanthosine triphosphatase [Candidatus Parcubacteria bacterium]|nr:inosine/xanthosine triphosphatase [Candidatus Parcubacteria bacterium]
MLIILGTTSEIKQKALKEILKQYEGVLPFLKKSEIVPRKVDSLVPETPYNSQTLEGARNRVGALFNKYGKEGDLFIGLESGLVERERMLFEECWCVICDKTGKEHVGYSSGLFLPNHITDEMKKGKTHPEVLKILAEEIGIHHQDTWSIYSNGKLSRIESVKEAFRNALLSIKPV